MFTIKHIDINGNEGIVECESFVRERRDDGFIQYLAYGANPLPGEYRASWCGDEEQRTSALTNRQTLYVMNRFGATVATYRFTCPDFSHCGEAKQAVPAFVTA